MKKHLLGFVICTVWLSGPLTLMGAQAIEQGGVLPYQDDPKIMGIVKSVEAGQLIKLPNFKILPDKASSYHHAFKKGPGVRDFCNKISYAPDRQSGLYCGANHHVPHRLNDVWEYHLGSNTWSLICPPGPDATRARELAKKLKENPDNEALKKRVNAYWENMVVKDGYIQDRKNGGPLQPWHTWDAVTYDSRTKRLYWNVLDSDNHASDRLKSHSGRVRNYAKRTGQDAEALLKTLKPGSAMYMYDVKQARWTRQLGKGPFPVMRAMGATLHYIPDMDKTLSYVCAGNRPGGQTEGMWAYDAKKNTWEELIPGNKVAALKKKGTAPGEELQVAYSPKHKKLAAVYKNGLYLYDVEKNTWARGKDGIAFGHDSKSVFVYDDHADVFLLLGRKGNSMWSQEPYGIYAYDLKTDHWETVKVKGLGGIDDSKQKNWLKYGFAGYYDTHNNAFVLYEGRNHHIWIYRHQK